MLLTYATVLCTSRDICGFKYAITFYKGEIMKCCYYGGFLSKSECYNFHNIFENIIKHQNPDLLLNLSLSGQSLHKQAPVMGYTNSVGCVFRYIGTPTRLQKIAEAHDAFANQKWDTPMYHITRRTRNKKGETVGVEMFKTNKIKQVGLNLLAKLRIYMNK